MASPWPSPILNILIIAAIQPSMDILLEMHYLPCLQYFSKFELYDHIIIDDTEAFAKQSYRNRAAIATANGRTDLIVPVHDSRRQLPIKEVLIDNHGRWQHVHLQSIRSAYAKTPFFEHYAHLFAPHYQKEYRFLFDFDLDILHTLMKIMKIDMSKLILKSERQNDAAQMIDFKNKIHPKPRFQAEDPQFHSQKYFQAFEDRNGFIPNLSIIDRIFNEG